MNSRGTFMGSRPDVHGVKLEPLVKSDGECVNPRTNKVKIAFNTEGKAAMALASARKNHERLGHTMRIEQRYYLCPFGSRGGAAETHYHLTHVERWEPKEATNEQSGETS